LETGGARKKKELPLKILALGNFSHNQSNVPVAEREKFNINKNNFDQVLHEVGPKLNLKIPNTIKQESAEFDVALQFNSLKDFHPEQLVKHVPALRKLIAMRNLLKDLRSNVLNNRVFRKELEKIVHDSQKTAELKTLLVTNAPIIDDVLNKEE
jgi:type VI secretion system protein ImpB